MCPDRYFFDFLNWSTYVQRLNEARNEDDLLSIILDIEVLMPTFFSSPDDPFFVVTPPTFVPLPDLKHPSQWLELLQDSHIAPQTRERLLKSGFMPFDRKLLVRKALMDPFHDLDPQKRFVFIDTDYGVLVFEPDGSFAFRVLAESEFRRYRKHYSWMTSYSDVFSVGQMRVEQLAAVSGDAAVFAHEVETRSGLDAVIATLKRGLDRFLNYELWYRGQTQDHLMSDLRKEASAGICPWRSMVDSSLVPSLYRELPKKLGDLREYGAYCLEHACFSHFLDASLSLPTMSDDDLSPAFRSLQRSFFLQHYGLPSGILDITHDLDVALFFAQNDFDAKTGRFVPVDFSACRPVIYVMVLREGMDLYMNSTELSKHFGLLRPLRQRCGLLGGASFTSRNAYAKFISVKIYLRAPIKCEPFPPSYLFPPPIEDKFLSRLLDFAQSIKCSRMKPFVLDG